MWYSPYPKAYGDDDPGGGPLVAGAEEWGERWWYEEADPLAHIDLSWTNIISHWNQIETDFHHYFHTDFGDGTLHRRTWRWFTTRTLRLLQEDTALARTLGLRTPPRKE